MESAATTLANGGLRAAPSAAWRLFEAAWPVLERYVRARLIADSLPGKLVEDCGQEVFTRVWRFRESYRGNSEAEFWSWLAQVCDNERRRILGREKARSAAVSSRDNPELASETPLSGPDDAVSASVLSEELISLRQCLQDLDGRRRRVIELAYFDPILTERAIAELLECSPSYVHRLKVEGLRLLAACLSRKGVR